MVMDGDSNSMNLLVTFSLLKHKFIMLHISLLCNLAIKIFIDTLNLSPSLCILTGNFVVVVPFVVVIS